VVSPIGSASPTGISVATASVGDFRLVCRVDLLILMFHRIWHVAISFIRMFRNTAEGKLARNPKKKHLKKNEGDFALLKGKGGQLHLVQVTWTERTTSFFLFHFLSLSGT